MGALFSRAPEAPASPGAVDMDAAVAKALDHPTGHASGTPLAARAPPSHRARLPRPRSLLAGPPRLRVPAPSERSLALSPDRSAIWSCRRNAARPAPDFFPSPDPRLTPRYPRVARRSHLSQTIAAMDLLMPGVGELIGTMITCRVRAQARDPPAASAVGFWVKPVCMHSHSHYGRRRTNCIYNGRTPLSLQHLCGYRSTRPCEEPPTKDVRVRA
jgi:hypothetical protein